MIAVFSFLGWGYSGSRVSPAQAILPLSGIIIGVDPGHGGYDPGSSRGDIIEKDVVLQIALYLRDYLQQAGGLVVMTRDEDVDLLEIPAGPKKDRDFQNRKKIIEDSGADLLISIHANAITSSQWRGAQVFYQEGSEEGRLLASAIQYEMSRVLKNTDRQIKSSNFFMLREISAKAVIVEVGFLTNPEEADLLCSPDYQKKLAWSIYVGIINYLSQ
ncbi:MAG: N-acetylmuramoyl-L-alanine amidase [Bacillota bacterium]|nr:N-acetylmuramoyl-L-alanine amidase [Bacillota bacterium]